MKYVKVAARFKVRFSLTLSGGLFLGKKSYRLQNKLSKESLSFTGSLEVDFLKKNP